MIGQFNVVSASLGLITAVCLYFCWAYNFEIGVGIWAEYSIRYAARCHLAFEV